MKLLFRHATFLMAGACAGVSVKENFEATYSGSRFYLNIPLIFFIINHASPPYLEKNAFALKKHVLETQMA